MYKMGLLTGARTKSANIVGQTMRLNPHGDAAIYDTMVRLSRGYEALLTPFVDSKGNFGKVYSRDMACAASRYTEAKLSPICGELFATSTKTRSILPTTMIARRRSRRFCRRRSQIFSSAPTPVSPSAMASSICGFNLNEVCQTAIEFIGNPSITFCQRSKRPTSQRAANLSTTPTSSEHLRDRPRQLQVRARWRYIKRKISSRFLRFRIQRPPRPSSTKWPTSSKRQDA